MISRAERAYLWENAYVPEHVPEYVSAISGAEPCLVDDFVAYVSADQLIFIGYPLSGRYTAKACEKAIRRALDRFGPERVSLIGPDVPSSIANGASLSRDYYYRLETERVRVSQKVRTMLRRASKEVSVVKSGNFDEEHADLIDEFLVNHEVSAATRSIFGCIAEYTRAGENGVLFDARNSSGKLVAFDVAEAGAKEHLFYLFNFSSRQSYIPGASDLLLSEMIKEASARGKRFLNMGLGINPGVTFFKTKWGGRPFLPYVWCEYTVPRAERVKALFDKL